MKTANLTPWCNLFLTESNYNIGVKKSRYKAIFPIGGAVVLFVFLLLLFTYAYTTVLVIVIFSFLLFGVRLSNKNIENITVLSFDVNQQGRCVFDDNNAYQLQKNSRVSFFGCWLILQSEQTASLALDIKRKNKTTTLFIYRDSLSDQDFSRLSTVISQLNRQP